MSKNKQIEQAPLQEVMEAGEIVHAQIKRVYEQCPGLISFDLESEAGQLLALRCAVDPGVAAAARDGWRGIVTGWWIGPYEVTEEKTGEIVTLPSLVLLASNGELCRLTGWPAINSWGHTVRASSDAMRQRGIPVRVMRRLSGTGGRSYWQVVPDVCPTAPGAA